jgi:hypothetical protein
MKTLKLFSVLFILLLFLKTSIAQTDLIKEQTLQTNYGKNLAVSVPGGDVSISTWSKEEVYVKITGNENAKNNFDFTINSNSGDVIVKADKKTDAKNSDVSMKIEISVPDKFNTKVSTAGGDIKIDNNLTGDVKLNTAGGDIKISSITGDSKLNTAGGDISVDNFKGEINANTAGGDIKLNGSDGKVSANTSGGKVELKYSGENKDITLNTMGGDILIYLPSDFKADCKLTTMNGDIKSDIPISSESNENKNIKKNNVKGKMNNGGNVLKCSSMGGNITIKTF